MDEEKFEVSYTEPNMEKELADWVGKNGGKVYGLMTLPSGMKKDIAK